MVVNIIVFNCFNAYVPDRVKKALRELARQRGWGEVNIITTYSKRPSDRGEGGVYATCYYDLPDSQWLQWLRMAGARPLLAFDQPAGRVYEVTSEGQQVTMIPVIDA